MSEQEAPTKRYEVELTGTFTTWVEVDAEDEDAAHDAAKQEVSSLGSMVDWQDDRLYTVENITEVAS